MHHIVTWLSAGAGAREVRVAAPPDPGWAVVGESRDGRPIMETPVRIPPGDLVGVLTEVPDDLGTGPTAILLNVANQHHIGPNRLWVELARQWASDGIRALRVDLSGLGDSPRRHTDTSPWVPYKPEAFDDVLDAARWASPADPSNVVLVGLCASGYQALDSALGLHPRGVVAVNPSMTFLPAERRAGLPLDPRRRIVLPKDAVANTFREGGRLSWLRQRYPNLAWWVRVLGSPRRRSGAWLAQLTRQGTEVLLVCGEVESRPIRHGITGRKLRRLERGGRLRFERLPNLDHELLIATQRHAVRGLLADDVVSRFSPAAGADRGRDGGHAADDATDHGADTQPGAAPRTLSDHGRRLAPAPAPLGPTPRDRQQTGPPSA